MARTWKFAGHSSKDPKGAVSKKGDPAQSNEGVLSKNEIAVNDFATAHQRIRTKAIHSDSESDGSTTWVNPFSSPQKELNAQPTKEATDGSANLAKLIQKHPKSKDPPTAATPEEPTTSEIMEEFAPSSSAPRRAPIAQMVPLPSNAAVTTTPAGTAASETWTTSIFGPCPSTMAVSNPQAFLSATALPPLPLASILASSPKASSKKYTPKRSTPKTPKITLTPAPATAPSAFKDPTLAAHVQNTRFLSPVKQRTNGIKESRHVRTSSPPKPVLTPESVPEEKCERRRGRPRIRPEEPPLQQSKQQRPPVQPRTPCPRTGSSNQSNSSLFAPSSFPLQQQQAVTVNTNGDLNPELCSEEPRLWPGFGDHVTALQRFNSKPETIHSEPIRACSNRAVHQDTHEPHGHGVCTTCHHAARRHLRVTRPELLGSAWWPLCKACGDNELRYAGPDRNGCSCGKKLLCFSCRTQEVEERSMKNTVEAEFRRRTFIGEGMDGDVKTVKMGWACDCGEEIGPDATLMMCIGCQGMIVGKLNLHEEVARQNALTKTALAWT